MFSESNSGMKFWYQFSSFLQMHRIKSDSKIFFSIRFGGLKTCKSCILSEKFWKFGLSSLECHFEKSNLKNNTRIGFRSLWNKHGVKQMIKSFPSLRDQMYEMSNRIQRTRNPLKLRMRVGKIGYPFLLYLFAFTLEKVKLSQSTIIIDQYFFLPNERHTRYANRLCSFFSLEERRK